MKLLKRLLVGVLSLALTVSPAWAQLGSVPYTFTPNTTILSAEVNANFSTVYSNALNRTGGTMTGSLTVQTILAASGNIYDIGASGTKFANIYAINFIGSGVSLTGVALLGATNTFTNSQIIGAGGTGAVAAGLTMAGGSASGGGGFVVFSRNSTANAYMGSQSAILGTTSSDALIYATSGNGINFYTNAASAMSLSSGGLLAVSGFGTHTFSAGGTGANLLIVRNSTAGTGNYGNFQVGNDANAGLTAVYSFSSTFTPSGANFANGTLVQANGAGGMTLQAQDAAGSLRFFTGGSSQRFGVNAAGDFTFGTSAHLMFSNGTPAIASGFGPSPTIAGTDYAFVVSTGNTASATGVVNFGHTFSAAPVCIAAGPAAANPIAAASTTTAVTLTYISSTLQTIGVHCTGY